MAMRGALAALGGAIPPALHFPMQAASGIAFPITAFLLAEGYRRTSSRRRYMGRMLAFALAAQVPFMMAYRAALLNVMFLLLFGLLTLALYDRMKRRWLFWIAFAPYALLSIFADYGFLMGPAMIVMHHAIRNEARRRTVPAAAGGAYSFALSFAAAALLTLQVAANQGAMPERLAAYGYELPEAWMHVVFSIGIFAAIPLIRAYSGERGRGAKYFFYAFYPLHLLAFALAAFALGLSSLGLFPPGFFDRPEAAGCG